MSMKPAILERLRGVQRSGNGWTAFCPSHPDEHTRSLSVSLAPDGKTLLHCFVGCTAEQIVAAADMSMADLMGSTDDRQRPRRAPLTLAAFAEAKGLPVDFLRELGVVEDTRGLRITYRLADGSEAPRQRRRTALMAKDGSTWDGPRGESPVAYGLWRLDDALDRGELWLVEGETDALSAWLHNLAALGVPGADMAKVLTADVLRGVERLWIIQEPDRGGSTFVAGCARRLPELAWSGEARVVRLPTKDLNDLHRMAGDGFADALARAQAEAVPLAAAGGTASPAEPADVTRPPAASAGLALEPAGLVVAGDDVVLTWAAHDVTITAARPRIRESGGAGRAELNVTRAGRHLHLADFPLASTASRRTEVKALDEIDPTVPWRDLVAHACRVLVDYSRTGDGPAVELKPQMRGGERYLVKPLLVAGHATVLFGDGGHGKGWGAVLTALLVASGTSIAWLTPTRRGAVLYLDWEADKEDQQERLALLGRGLGVDPSGVFYRRMSRALPDAAAEIRADLHSIGDVQLIVVDSLMPAGGGGGDRSWHDVSNTVFTTLRTFGPTAQLILAHLSRSDADRPGQGAKPFGSVFNTNLPRAVWEWRRADGAPDELLVGCYHTKANNTPKSPPLGLRFIFEPNPEHPERVSVVPHDLAKEPDLLARAGLRDQLREALRAGALSVPDLAEALGKSKDSVRRTLNRMADRGAAIKLPGDTWGLPA